jgi:hypothetical protein
MIMIRLYKFLMREKATRILIKNCLHSWIGINSIDNKQIPS